VSHSSREGPYFIFIIVTIVTLSGAEVVGTASAAKQEAVRALDAIPVDYRNEDVPARVREIAPAGVAAVFGHVGGPGLVDSWRMLGRGGTLVSYGVASALDDRGHRLRPFVPIVGRILLWNALPNGRRATFYYVRRWPKHFRGDLERVFALLVKNEIDAQVARRLPLEKATEALALLASGKVSGKVVLTPGLA